MRITKSKIIIAIALFAAVLCTVQYKIGSYVFVMSDKSTPYAVRVPVIMYHSVAKDSRRSGRYVIMPEQLEDDLKYINDNGYHTVFVKELIDYVYSGAALPENPVVLSFDDGCYNNKEYALPLLEKYNEKAIISIVGKYTDIYTDTPDENPNYASLSWNNVNDIIKSGHIEIGNHTNDMHYLNHNGRKGCKKKRGEGECIYKEILKDDLDAMQNKCYENLGMKPLVFTYPFGSICSESESVIKEIGFMASLSCEEGINYIADESDLYKLKRLIRTNVRGVEQILTKYADK